MFKLSVCMIVKDEELVLDRILSAVAQFADEIIIVDTGSKDTTKEIAFKYTDKVFDFKWINDFASARNYSFSKATCDYIMWLDADDTISAENIEKIKHLKETTTSTDVFMLKYVMDFRNGKPNFVFYRERIVKRINNFMWSGFVHEVITPSGKIEYLDIEIEHRKIKISNPKRNLNLYNHAKKNGVIFNAREQYYYSRELYYNGYFKKGICEIRKYFKLNDGYTPNIIGAYLILSDMYLKTNDIIKAKNTLFDCIKYYIPTAEICVNIARIYELEKDSSKAIFWYHTALICPKQNGGFIRTDMTEFIPYVELCKLYYSLGNMELAKKYHLLAKNLDPEHPTIVYNNQFF